MSAMPGVPAPLAVVRGAPVIVNVAVDAEVWDREVAGHPDATVYHLWAWREVFRDALGHHPHYLIARREGRVVGGLPIVELHSRLFGRFGVSLPFVNYGGVIAADRAASDALIGEALGWARSRGLRHVELRHRDRLAPAWPARHHKVAMWLPLMESAEAQWAALDRKVRNQIRKAEKSGLTVAEGGVEWLDAFYGVFAHHMRDLGTPVLHRRVFDAVARALPPHARFFVVRHAELPVAASLTLAFRGTVEVPWASALRTHNDKAPNMLLYWAMLKAAIAAGATRFDFGRSTPDEGPFHFKRQWGAEPHPLVWEYAGLGGPIPDQSPGNPKFRLAIAGWQRLPVRVATWLGPGIVRHIP